MSGLILIVIAVFVLFVTFTALISRYKRCPSDKILVIYGKTGGSSAKCIHGGGSFVWPVIQDFAYLDLKPISIEANLTNALSRQNIRVDVLNRARHNGKCGRKAFGAFTRPNSGTF